MDGWVKLHRCILDKAIWTTSNPEQKVILVTILCLANHEEKQWHWKGKKFICKPGQFITSSISLASKSGCSRQNVRTALTKFQNYDFLTYESTKTGILITVVNWDKYQSYKEETNQPTNQDLTNSQPTANQQLTTNKNYKNNKNNKNNKKYIYADFVSMTEEEYKKLIDAFGENGTKDRIENLSLYKGSTGKKYASDYLTILAWERKEKKTNKRRDEAFGEGTPL